MKVSIVAIAAMGLMRFALDAGGVPREVVKYFSMTAVMIACSIYFAIATTTHKERLKAAYLLVMPYMTVEVIALSYTWATGRQTIFSAAEYSLGYSLPLHTVGHLIGGLTWEPLFGFLMMEIIWVAYRRVVGMKSAGAIVGLICALATHVEAAEIKVISTGGARAVMTSVVPEFERKSGHKVSIDFGTPGNMRDRLLQGEAADVAIAIAATLPDLEKAGKIAPGTRMEFASSYVGVVVRAGAPKLDVSTPDGLKRAMLNAKTVALSDPKAGTQLGATFTGVADRLGFGADLRSRTKWILGPGSDVAEAVAKGEADLGVTLISEILPVTGVALGGELPSSIMPPTVIHAFLVSGAKNVEAAKAFLDFLRSPEATRIIEAKGMKPGPR